MTEITEEMKTKLTVLANKYDHDFHKRNDGTIELVKMFGDQVDNRILIQEEEADGDTFEAKWTFWTESNGTKKSDETWTDMDDCDFYADVERFLKVGLKLFKIEVIQRDGSEEDW